MKNLTQIVIIITLLTLSISVTAQNEMEFRSDGIVLPRTDITTVVSPSKGQMVYDTNFSEVMYYDGNAWQQFSSGGGGGGTADFSNGGDAATSHRSLGNTNALGLGFLTNNIERMHIDGSGDIGVGTNNPIEKLHILDHDPDIVLQNTGTIAGL